MPIFRFTSGLVESEERRRIDESNKFLAHIKARCAAAGFLFDKKIGQGIEGDVWKATQGRGSSAGRCVAIKLIDASRNGEGTPRKEANMPRLHSVFNHRKIIDITAWDEVEGHWFSTSYEPGGTLWDFIHKIGPRRSTNAMVCQFSIDMIEVIHFLHTGEVQQSNSLWVANENHRAIAHGDAHSNNWLVRIDARSHERLPTLVLADFGHAVLRTRAPKAFSYKRGRDIALVGRNIDTLCTLFESRSEPFLREPFAIWLERMEGRELRREHWPNITSTLMRKAFLPLVVDARNISLASKRQLRFRHD